MPRRVLLLVLPLLCGLVPAGAVASPGKGPTAAVSLGDSYISGEAGRWQGNSLNSAPGNDGSDRACVGGPPCSVDKSRVYVGASDANNCHRSDVSEILTAQLPVAERINIACSGGVTKNIFRASSGGEGQNGELPQADQLLPIAKAKDIKLVQVSVGGNDLGFAGIVAACLQAYVSKGTPCNETQQPKLEAAKPKAIADVEKAIDEIRAVMTEAGYASTDYRLVLQTYPSVIPRASESRYGENDPNRPNVCPFYDVDLTWGRDSASKQIGGVVKAAATARGVELIDLADAFAGHEFCAKTTSLVDPFTPPSATGSEWGRFLGGPAIQQGQLQEVFHPNAYGQAAFASCVGQAFARPAGTFTCSSSAGRAPQAMTLTQTSDLRAAGCGGQAPAAPRDPAPRPQRGPDLRDVQRPQRGQARPRRVRALRQPSGTDERDGPRRALRPARAGQGDGACHAVGLQGQHGAHGPGRTRLTRKPAPADPGYAPRSSGA